MPKSLSIDAEMDKLELPEKFIYVEHQVFQGCQVNEALIFFLK